MFPFWQRLGFHVTPNHFYQPVPDTRELTENLWSEPSKTIGIDWNEQMQLSFLAQFEAEYKEEYKRIPADKTSNPYEFYMNNKAFTSIDAEILYCMIRHFKPGKICEIGAGFSTRLSAQTILKNKEENEDDWCQLETIEPFGNDLILKGFPGLSRVIRKKVQEVPIDYFDHLKENDILFVDSSHVLKIGSDVKYEYLEILPRLRKGVIVHIHDIFLPAEYPKHWFKELKFWNEQYLVQAFLTFNCSFEILWGGSYMHLNYPEKLIYAFPSYDNVKNWPGSLWIRKVE